MRIAINTISTKKGSGGAYQIAYNFLMESLKHQEDAEWYYITSSDVDELVGKAFEQYRGTRYFVFPTQPDFLRSYLHTKKELARWEDVYNPDIIYSISSPCYFSFKNPEVMRFANAWVTNPNKYAWSSMSLKSRSRMRLYCWNQKRLLRKASYIITQSETVKQGLLRITNLEDNQIAVVSNVLPQVFSCANVEKRFSNYWIDIACVAAPVPHKNIDIIPKVLQELRDKYNYNNVRFHLTIPDGNALLTKLQDECDAQGLSGRIVNHGHCTQHQLIEVYNQCRLCFLPTLLETFSASSLEAMRFELLIVATNFDFNREVIADAGIYYTPMDANDAASKIAALLNDRELQVFLLKRMRHRIQLYDDYAKHFRAIIEAMKRFRVMP